MAQLTQYRTWPTQFKKVAARSVLLNSMAMVLVHVNNCSRGPASNFDYVR